MRLINRLPEWDSTLECLVLKFQGNRVHFPSARNILLYDEHSLEMQKRPPAALLGEGTARDGKKTPTSK
jgi:hypothetical protein